MYRRECGIYMSTGLRTGAYALVLAAAIMGVPALVAAKDLESVVYKLPMGVIIINANSLLQANSLSSSETETPELASRFLMTVTAYSSSVDETDSTPHITASGTRTRHGIVASNTFPIGTRVRIPELFGDEVFVIEDRMHRRFTDRIDIWMPSKWQALQFGKRQASIEIVEL